MKNQVRSAANRVIKIEPNEATPNRFGTGAVVAQTFENRQAPAQGAGTDRSTL